ncbi:MAG: Archaeal Type pilin, N-terminal [Candidatus Methanomethylophilaceae archaeon]|nr:Archaeal Type pilin, N-terminal [Candidatus Methanomethylophilaceae archaeon]
MKSIRKFKKNAEAVSPVIATILMVAITVVLAAVLLVMVMNMTEDTPPSSAAITATADDAGHLTVTVSVINAPAPASDILVKAVNSGNSTVYTLNGTWSGTQVSNGAIFTAGINQLDEGSTYTIQLVYEPNGAVLGSVSVTIPESVSVTIPEAG